MRFQLFSGVMAATVIVNSVLPAYANPTDSWINHSAITKDPRALCDDVVGQKIETNIGEKTQNNIESSSYSSNESSNQANSRQTHKSGQGGFSFGSVRIGGGGASISNTNNQTVDASSKTHKSTVDKSSLISYDKTIVTHELVGTNCKAFLEGAALVDVTRIQSETQRHAIDNSAKMNLLNVIFGTSNPQADPDPGTLPYNPYMIQPGQ